jgi:hypothetical protein
MRGLEVSITIKTQVSPTLVICEDENDIGFAHLLSLLPVTGRQDNCKEEGKPYVMYNHFYFNLNLSFTNRY